MFQRKEKDGVYFWQEDSFSQSGLVSHGFSERGADGQFNLALHTNDDPMRVLANRERFTAALGITMAQTVTMEQVHGLNVAVIGSAERGRGMRQYADAIKATDGLITQEKSVALMGCFADCVPLFFLDPVKEVIALSHGGWKGTVGGIAALTVKKMQEQFGCEAKDILAAIGPSVGPCHYEVDKRVIDEVRKFAWWREVLSPTSEGHGRLDLWECNRRQLLDIGLAEKNISVSGLCTYCHNDKFFSYRAEDGRTGRMAAVIMLV